MPLGKFTFESALTPIEARKNTASYRTLAGTEPPPHPAVERLDALAVDDLDDSCRAIAVPVLAP